MSVIILVLGISRKGEALYVVSHGRVEIITYRKANQSVNQKMHFINIIDLAIEYHWVQLIIMKSIHEKIEDIDWQRVTEEIDERGYAIVSQFLPEQSCEELIRKYDDSDLYRKTITMERHRFGLGEYKYFKYPLPDLIQTVREEVYPKLVPIANSWMKMLNIERQFPDTFDELQKLCHDNKQTRPTVLILKYGKGGHNTLHQDLYGDIFFPFQLVFFLNDPDDDYTGGEFVLTQQIPRAQSKAIVLKPHKGDMLIISTNVRPIKGSKGYYRAQMRHGISEVHDGERHTLGIIFHDGLN